MRCFWQNVRKSAPSSASLGGSVRFNMSKRYPPAAGASSREVRLRRLPLADGRQSLLAANGQLEKRRYVGDSLTGLPIAGTDTLPALAKPPKILTLPLLIRRMPERVHDRHGL